jgi:antitoxin HigA-1
LEAALGSSAQMWVGMQSAYDLWQARKRRHPKIDRLAA